MPSYKKIDVEKTLSELSINDKVKLLGGKGELSGPVSSDVGNYSRGHSIFPYTALSTSLSHFSLFRITDAGSSDFWHFHEVEGIVPPIRCSDGPNGVRGTRFFNGVPVRRHINPSHRQTLIILRF